MRKLRVRPEFFINSLLNFFRKIAMNRLFLILGLAIASDRKREKYPYEVDFGRNLGVVTGFTAEGYEDVVHLYGVPYAHPPTGDRRFRVPELMEYWPEGQVFMENMPMCPQIMFDGSTLDIADEDCLYVNIWAPADAVEGRLSRLGEKSVRLTSFKFSIDILLKGHAVRQRYNFHPI